MSAQARPWASGAFMRTPGEHLRAEMQRLGFDQGALADALGVSWQSVNNIVTNRLRFRERLRLLAAEHVSGKGRIGTSARPSGRRSTTWRSLAQAKAVQAAFRNSKSWETRSICSCDDVDRTVEAARRYAQSCSAASPVPHRKIRACRRARHLSRQRWRHPLRR